jgi:hypothetical protein
MYVAADLKRVDNHLSKVINRSRQLNVKYAKAKLLQKQLLILKKMYVVLIYEHV